MVLGHQGPDNGGHPVEDRDPMQVAVFPLAVPYLLNPAAGRRPQKYDDAELKMLGLMRNRLSIPEGDPALPPPGYSHYEVEEPAADAE